MKAYLLEIKIQNNFLVKKKEKRNYGICSAKLKKNQGKN